MGTEIAMTKRNLHLHDYDPITSLPDNVCDAILVRLPMKDAVRTSKLSRAWRYKWRSMPDLVFEYSSLLLVRGKRPTDQERKIVDFVNHVLLLHDGTIRKFKFSSYLDTCSAMDTWIHVLVKSGIQEFILRFPCDGRYKVPSYLFQSETLVVLKLQYCLVRLPHVIKGLVSLATLVLEGVTFLSSNDLELLVSNSPLLERLRVRYCKGCHHLRVCAPNLTDLLIFGSLYYLHFDHAPKLAFASIKMTSRPRVTDNFGIEGSFNLTSFLGGVGCVNLTTLLGGLECVERLEIQMYFLQFLSAGNVPACLPSPFAYLNYLEVALDFNCLKGTMAVLCLVRSSPVLNHLHIESLLGVPISPIAGFWEAKEFLECELPHLKVLDLKNMSGVKPEMKFTEFVLANAPLLEDVNFHLAEMVSENLAEAQKIYKMLLSLKRASTKASICC